MLAPEKHTFDTLWGHEAARRLVPRLLGAGRLPHALLLVGPDGIGKRSLALAMVKAILSAGRPAGEATLTAPRSPAAKRRVPDPPPPEEEDLFGAVPPPPAALPPPPAEEPDLFGDAFAAPPAPPPSVPDPAAAPLPEPEAPAPPPAPKKPRSRKKEDAPAASQAAPAAPAPLPEPPPLRRELAVLPKATFRGFDPRVCRLVEQSYAPDKKDADRPGHLDLTIIEPTQGRRGIVVDQVRALQDAAAMAPMEGAYRVVLILGADTITQEGGNSILKLLEEPPSYLVLILVASSVTRMLPTIKSRCAVVPLSPLPQALLTQKLIEEEKLQPDLARVAAALSEGRPGAALALVGAAVLERRRAVFDARLQLDRYGPCTLAAASARIAAQGKLEELLWLLTSFTRDRLVRALAPDHPELLVHGDAVDVLDQGKPDPADLDEEADRLVDAYRVLRHPYVPNVRVVLQTALAEG